MNIQNKFLYSNNFKSPNDFSITKLLFYFYYKLTVNFLIQLLTLITTNNEPFILKVA